MRDDVINYANANDIQNFIVLGHSMGGKVAAHLCSCYPSRIKAAIVIEAPPIDLTNMGGYAGKIKEYVNA